MKDFFISYTKSDAKWAEWIAWQLEAAGFEVEIQAWDFTPGSNFILKMDDATRNSDKFIAVLSKEYLSKVFTKSEWSNFFIKDPNSINKKIIPVRVSSVIPDGLFSSIVYIDLYKAEYEDEAIELLIAGVSNGRLKPEKQPIFPKSNISKNQENIVNKSNSFIYQKISKNEFLNLSSLNYPYGEFNDPTDYCDEISNDIKCFLWLPNNQYIQSNGLQNRTPVVAFCTSDLESIQAKIKKIFSLECSQLLRNTPPSKLINKCKENILKEISCLLSRSFIVAATIPSIILESGKNNPTVAYNAILDIFLLPLVQKHENFYVGKFNLILPKIGKQEKNVLGISKRILKAVYPKRDCTSVVFGNKQEVQDIFLLIKLIAWSVGTAHNSSNIKWIKYLERNII